MTVLYFADTRFPIERANGIQTIETCHALACRGYRVQLIVRPDSMVPGRDPLHFYGLAAVDGLTIHRVPASGNGPARRVRFLLSALARSRTDTAAVVFTRNLGVAALLLQAPFARRSRLVYESHGIAPIVSEEMPRLLGKPGLMPSESKLRRLDRREHRVWTHAGAYVTITHALAEDLSARYGPRARLFVVPDGARPASRPTPRASSTAEMGRSRPVPEPAELVADSSLMAAYAGHLYPWKGVDVFVRALALVPSLRGLIVGGHPAEADRARVEGLVQELGLSDRVRVTGLVPQADVVEHLRHASMLVLPNAQSTISERYTSPLKLFEYLALGLPVVASDLASIREIVTDESTALLVPPGDPHALAAALHRLAEDPALRARLGRMAGELSSRYTWNARAARLEQAIEAAAQA